MRRAPSFAVLFAVLASFILCLIRDSSPTCDEPVHLAAGYADLVHGTTARFFLYRNRVPSSVLLGAARAWALFTMTFLLAATLVPWARRLDGEPGAWIVIPPVGYFLTVANVERPANAALSPGGPLLFAISETNRVGTYDLDHAPFDWLRTRPHRRSLRRAQPPWRRPRGRATLSP